MNNELWSDHTDIQPTMWELLGLHADYAPAGRAVLEVIDPSALPATTRPDEHLLVQLGELYKQLEDHWTPRDRVPGHGGGQPG